ncbi:uncharacterized protein LOC130672639 isoform X2 [Microplitis mediator]|uniref:uncharacterized protein LOC130672639 isoform X2 n=1 Tax=Microplitis mediator TaxID=375433 RepID=UPI0025537FEE|nr:uncharacterized protein LOC130672639 isoform X2 [Microplitis mediator]
MWAARANVCSFPARNDSLLCRMFACVTKKPTNPPAYKRGSEGSYTRYWMTHTSKLQLVKLQHQDGKKNIIRDRTYDPRGSRTEPGARWIVVGKCSQHTRRFMR